MVRRATCTVERIGNVSLQTHIDYLLAAFKASFEMVPPMPYILEASVYSVYKDYGWDVLADKNVRGRIIRISNYFFDIILLKSIL